jgi:acyl-coenzyme A thioesterase PaaI-like protein
VVYGGLIASLIDCHSIGTAVAAAYQHEGREPGSLPAIMFVTANLNVNYLKPTPMDSELLLRASPRDSGPRKMTVACALYAGETLCAHAEVLAVRVPSRDDATLGR